MEGFGAAGTSIEVFGRILSAHNHHHRHRPHHDPNVTLSTLASAYESSVESRSHAALKFVHEHGGSWFIPDGGRYSAPPPPTRRRHAPYTSCPLTVRCTLASLAVESVLLVVAFKACLIMWCAARRTKRADDYSAVGANDALVEASHESTYRRLRNLYLSVYALATFGDWIQGGFLYALYAEYGYSMRAVSLIFVVGYASAATAGTYVAALGDLGGHRRNCVAYGILYAMSCALCNFQSLWVLLVGRVLSGIAYSILYTSFESWLIAEADARRLPMPLLSRLFSVATFTNAVRAPPPPPPRMQNAHETPHSTQRLPSPVVAHPTPPPGPSHLQGTAVLAGILGHLAVEVVPHTTHNKFASAFDVAVVVLLGAAGMAATRWGERFGGDGSGGGATSASESLLASCRAIRRSRELLYLGLVRTCTGTCTGTYTRPAGHCPRAPIPPATPRARPPLA